MKHEKNVINGAVSVAPGGMIDFLTPLKWLALLGLVLIIVDLRFGVSAAKVRDETVWFSRSGRRTFNKTVDCVCRLLPAAAPDKAFIPLGIPLLPAPVLPVIYGFEINSRYSNYFESWDKKTKSISFRYSGRKRILLR